MEKHIDTRRRSYLFQLTSYISFPSTKSLASSPLPAGHPHAGFFACPQSGTLKLNRTLYEMEDATNRRSAPRLKSPRDRRVNEASD